MKSYTKHIIWMITILAFGLIIVANGSAAPDTKQLQKQIRMENEALSHYNQAANGLRDERDILLPRVMELCENIGKEKQKYEQAEQRRNAAQLGLDELGL